MKSTVHLILTSLFLLSCSGSTKEESNEHRTIDSLYSIDDSYLALLKSDNKTYVLNILRDTLLILDSTIASEGYHTPLINMSWSDLVLTIRVDDDFGDNIRDLKFDFSQKAERIVESSEKQESFGDFLTQFSTDTAFQLSRVQFPHEQEIIDPHEGGKATIVYEDSTDWNVHINLEYLSKYQDGIELDYAQDTVWNSNSKVTIQQRGDFSAPNTKWYTDYTFELISNRWFLTSSVDLSY